MSIVLASKYLLATDHLHTTWLFNQIPSVILHVKADLTANLLYTEGRYDLLLPFRSSAEHHVQRMRLRIRYHSNVVAWFGGYARFVHPTYVGL